MTKNTNIIEIKNLGSRLGGKWVLKGLDLNVNRGEILGIIGGSGAGKTTLLRALLMLAPPQTGSIRIFERELTTAGPKTLLEIQRRWGVLFQSNALFSSLTVLENTSFPLLEHTSLDEQTIRDIALLKIRFAGLPVDSAVKYPAELSGGMQKRAGLARSIVMDPELLFLDEPTTGLDPRNVSAFDELILGLQSTMGLTIVVVSHDIASLERVTNRVAFLGEGKVLGIDPLPELMKNPHPLIQAYFKGSP
jgi:phospholipid/cholesterol/gamma-HCH transport system ATP-binding protein